MTFGKILNLNTDPIKINIKRKPMSKTKRNGDIIKSYKKEINLQTKSVKSKKDYQRKPKYKGNYDENSN